MSIYAKNVLKGLNALNSPIEEINSFSEELSKYNEAIISTAFSANISSLSIRTNESVVEIYSKLESALKSLNNSSSRNSLIKEAQRKDYELKKFNDKEIKDANTNSGIPLTGSKPRFNLDDKISSVMKM